MAKSDSDERFWDRLARKYAADPIADMAGYERTLERARGYLRPTDKVLEFGCGTGTTALKLAPSVASLVATDVSGEMIAIAREKAAAADCANAIFERGTFDTAQFGDGAFDAALGFNVLHLVRDLPASLGHVRRLVRPGGLFISKTACLGEASVLIRLAVPVAQWIGKAPHVGMLTGEALKREILHAGFTLVEEAKHGSKRSDFRPFFVARAP